MKRERERGRKRERFRRRRSKVKGGYRKLGRKKPRISRTRAIPNKRRMVDGRTGTFITKKHLTRLA